MQEYGIQGFPTIKVFGVGKSPLDYQGAREAKPIVDYALGQVLLILHYSHIPSVVDFQSYGEKHSWASFCDGKNR